MADKNLYQDEEKRKRTIKKTAEYFKPSGEDYNEKIRGFFGLGDSSSRKKLAEKLYKQKSGTAYADE